MRITKKRYKIELSKITTNASSLSAKLKTIAPKEKSNNSSSILSKLEDKLINKTKNTKNIPSALVAIKFITKKMQA